jgi:hypothetical protein
MLKHLTITSALDYPTPTASSIALQLMKLGQSHLGFEIILSSNPCLVFSNLYAMFVLCAPPPQNPEEPNYKSEPCTGDMTSYPIITL